MTVTVSTVRTPAARDAQTAARERSCEQSDRPQPAPEPKPQRTFDAAAHRLRSASASLVRRHPKAVAYGMAGLVAAVLILLIGFWPTLLIALLAGIGVALGGYRDGDATLHRFAAQAAHRLKK